MERARLNRAVERQANAHRQLDGVPVENGKRPRQAECHRIDVRVRVVTETVGTGGEQFGGRGQFDVHFESAHQFVSVDQIRTVVRSDLDLGGAHDRPPVASIERSRVAATLNIGCSPNVDAITCTPMGKPSRELPNGTLMAG